MIEEYDKNKKKNNETVIATTTEQVKLHLAHADGLWLVTLSIKARPYQTLSYDSGTKHTVAVGAEFDFDFTVGQCLVCDENSAS